MAFAVISPARRPPFPATMASGAAATSVTELTTPAEAGAARLSATEPRVAAMELPTLMVAALAYGGWLGVTLMYGHWPLWVVAPLTAMLITLHGSLQHEIVHGHPTRWRRVNRLLAMVPLSL